MQGAHPQRLGKFQVTGVLGQGAMGVVYRGFDPDIRRVVAIKTIRHQISDDAEAMQRAGARFRHEAQAAGRLLHPGIVGVYDFGDDGQVAYIAMEFVEGHTLARYLAAKVRFDAADVVCLGAQLLDALAHAHEHGVWHRDIKPSNVILTPQGQVKIADFGIARTDSSGLTQANTVLGTPLYMAPEQFAGRGMDHRADLYACGVLLHQLLTGAPPFSGPAETLMYRVMHEPPPRISESGGAVHGPAFDELIAAALAKDPQQRPPSARVLRQSLLDTLGDALPRRERVSLEAVRAIGGAEAYATTMRLPRDGEGPDPPPHATGGGSRPPVHWDAGTLGEVEHSLARHVGPMASVMVRRAARQAADLPALLSMLAGQIDTASVREAFLHDSTHGRTGSRSHGGPGAPGAHGAAEGVARAAHSADAGAALRSHGGHRTGGSTGAARPLSDAAIEQAQALLARHAGPIARIVVQRALQRTRQRGAFFALLADAAPEAARAALLHDLERLP